MIILGIESSADETAAAVIENGHKLLSSVVASSIDLHIPFGGIVPEIAARSHLEVIIPVIEEALRKAFLPNAKKEERRKKKVELQRKLTPYSLLHTPQSAGLWSQIDAIAVTQGPGLLGSLLIGVLTARTLAIAKNKPLIPVNHVHAHIYASFITETSQNVEERMRKAEKSLKNPRRLHSSFFILHSPLTTTQSYLLPEKQPGFPLLALIVSGGHTQLVLLKSHADYKILGQTADDAVGEAFDKVAKMLGLPYPGGASISLQAKNGNSQAIKLPTAKMDNPYAFSFSGPKTAVLRAAQSLSGNDYTFPSTGLSSALNEAQKADIAASFQFASVKTLANALLSAKNEFKPKSIAVVGGVAANQTLRDTLLSQVSPDIIFPDLKLCTDNAAMIAATAFYNQAKTDPFSLEPDPNLKM